jgi:hypothetical protein
MKMAATPRRGTDRAREKPTIARVLGVLNSETGIIGLFWQTTRPTHKVIGWVLGKEGFSGMLFPIDIVAVANQIGGTAKPRPT